MIITYAGTLSQPYTHHWGRNTETFPLVEEYNVSGAGIHVVLLHVLVARTKKDVLGKPQRTVATVFGKLSTCKNYTHYVSFTEDDHGTFAADIPNPAHPHSRRLTPYDPLPAHLASSIIERKDKLFDPVKRSRLLRLAVQPGDEIAMIKHALWIAGLRGYI